jgi:hypothetical protein
MGLSQSGRIGLWVPPSRACRAGVAIGGRGEEAGAGGVGGGVHRAGGQAVGCIRARAEWEAGLFRVPAAVLVGPRAEFRAQACVSKGAWVSG